MSKRNPDRSIKKAMVSELTLVPRSPGHTTESAYRQSLEASPSFRKELSRVAKQKGKKPGKKKR